MTSSQDDKDARPPQIRILEHQPGLRDQMLTAALAARQQDRLRDIVAAAIARLPDETGPRAEQRAREAVTAFLALYDDRPVQDNKGGSGFNDSLWLFVVASVLQPRLIVESGVFKGHSTWLLRQACPAAELFCFDPEPAPRVYTDPQARYHDGDWMEVELSRRDAARTLIFFDDHMSHARRLIEARQRGFRRILLDDDFPAEQLYATGWPPVPSLQMLFDPALADLDELRWARNGKVYGHTLDHAEIKAAKALVSDHMTFPELAPVTRYGQGSGLSFVKLLD